jgi:hypothetical protein
LGLAGHRAVSAEIFDLMKSAVRASRQGREEKGADYEIGLFFTSWEEKGTDYEIGLFFTS